ncbi:lysylphosphatidylglycerol synthase transmembrane domain-containing protein [Nocardioides sp.]|uniref:lysylphosphatidylglycerol synthase transmembrane domain-containing protein n=1 Tax=Nocardioides sp. TaxID=35761 RepID=UPI003D0B49CD
MRSLWWTWLKVGGGLVILALLWWRLGSAPFRDGLRSVDAGALLAASAIAVVTTVASAWRWRVVARGVDVDLPLRAAVAACYRSQFLNSVLPGGILGDVHRGIRHGQQLGRIGTGMRAVVWERIAGQVVLAALAVPALLSLTRSPLVWLAIAGAGLLAVLALRQQRRLGVPVLAPTAWATVALASAVAVCGYVATFLVAASAVGSDVGAGTLVPVAVLVLLASSIPVNIGGWGPREGAAAWVFSLAGLSASLGLSVAVAYGVMGLVATLPGAVVLLADRLEPTPRHVGRAA